MNAMLSGIFVGVITALLDAMLMWYGMRRAAHNKDKAAATVITMLAVRYLLLAAVLAVVLTAGRGKVDAVGVILPMIAQKAVLILITFFKR